MTSPGLVDQCKSTFRPPIESSQNSYGLWMDLIKVNTSKRGLFDINGYWKQSTKLYQILDSVLDYATKMYNVKNNVSAT